MPKPNSSSTVSEIKAYIRMKKLNQPELKLNQSKPALVAGLKKHGHWSESAATKRSTRGKEVWRKELEVHLDDHQRRSGSIPLVEINQKE